MAHTPRPVMARVQAIAAGNTRRSRLLRRVSGVARSASHRIAAGPAKGLRIEVGDSRPSYLLGTAERAVQDAMAERLGPGDVFYDLGANVGYFSMVAAALGAKVYAYEPFPSNVALLERNARGLPIAVRPSAASDRAGEGAFAEGPTSQDGKLSDSGGLTVRTVALDDETPAPTFVKIDVEGAEAAVLEGMRRTLSEHHPVVLVELHDEPYTFEHPVALGLLEHGYQLSWLERERGWAPHLLAYRDELR